MVNVDNKNYDTIVDNVIIDACSQWRNFSNICCTMYILKFVQMCVEKMYRRVKIIVITRNV